MDLTYAAFWFFAGWAVISAVLTITRSNAVASALWLVSAMFALAAIFVLLQAQFIGAIQVLVYAGAVMVLFLFVIMLLNLETIPRDWPRLPAWLAGVALSLVMGLSLLALRGYTPERLAREFSTMPGLVTPAIVFPESTALDSATAAHGVVGGVAQPLFQAYLVPFEITSVLLLVAAIGAVVLAKRRL